MEKDNILIFGAFCLFLSLRCLSVNKWDGSFQYITLHCKFHCFAISILSIKNIVVLIKYLTLWVQM